ncbi:hypothetical protein B0H14DRAFT_2617604 [Mycena olivaceomarginata]|nr:hypothetical protein B0H14DRAFT_2617604 [Mycena olivaceomarginata]
MTSSQALIPWEPVSNNGVVVTQENSHPERKIWALILNAFLSPLPGHTLNQVYTAAGKVLETHANHVAFKLGLGPHVIAGKIKLHFGDGEHQMQQLELLRTTAPPKLEKRCLKLMKYSLLTESASTQCQAFKEIVDLATLLPGLRVLFLYTNVLDNATSPDTISAFWDRSTSPSDKEWTFWQKLAATCLADTVISAMTEGNSLAGLVACDDDGLSTIERLLVEQDCGASNYTSALCLRYLAGVLNLPGFWQNLRGVHAQVAHKLCCRMVCVLKDIGVDIPSLVLIEEDPVDYDGVNLLATTLLSGLSSWFDRLDWEDWTRQPWYESFAQVLQLLWEPQAAKLLPHSSASATSTFEGIPHTSYQDRILNVMVDNQNTVPGDQANPADNYSTENLSAHSIDKDANQENYSQNIKSPDDSPGQSFGVDSEGLSLQDEGSISNESSDFSDPMLDDTGSDLSESEEQFGMVSGHGNVLQDLGCPEFLELKVYWLQLPIYVQKLSKKTLRSGNSYCSISKEIWGTIIQRPWRQWKILLGYIMSLESMALQGTCGLQCFRSTRFIWGKMTQLKEAQEVMVLALEKQRKGLALAYQDLGQFNKAQELTMSSMEKHSQLLGEDHPDTLWSMCSLADIYRQLDQLTEAENLYHIVVGKSIRILGENHPDTLPATRGLGMTYLASGQFKKAEDLLTNVFDKQKKVLGEEHPDTLKTMGTLANTYRQLGQLSAAEELATVAL